MKTLRNIMISILLFAASIYIISGLGTKVYWNNFSDLDENDIKKLTKLSIEVDLIETKLSEFNETQEFQQTDVSLVKEYIAEFLDSRSTVQQFVDFIKQAYRGGDIILMAFPYEVYNVLGFFIEVYRVFFIAIITIAIYVAIRGGDAVNG